MSVICIQGAGSGSAGSDECTAKLSDIPAGLKAVTADSNDEIGIGTMPDRGSWNSGDLAAGASVSIPAGRHSGNGRVTAKSLSAQTSATATAAQIRSGYSAWVNGKLIWGTLSIQSAINFSAAAVSATQIRISWQNPSIGPWEGVFIQMSTGGYPGTTGGSRVYTGTGSNTAAKNWNEVIISGLALGTTYYFTCTSYVNALGWGNSYNVSATTNATQVINGLPIMANGYGNKGAYVQIAIPNGANYIKFSYTVNIPNSYSKAGSIGLSNTTEVGTYSSVYLSVYGASNREYTDNHTFNVSNLNGTTMYFKVARHDTSYDYDYFIRINSAEYVKVFL